MALEPGVLNGVVEELAGPSQPRIKVGVVAQVGADGNWWFSNFPCPETQREAGAPGHGRMKQRSANLSHEALGAECIRLCKSSRRRYVPVSVAVFQGNFIYKNRCGLHGPRPQPASLWVKGACVSAGSPDVCYLLEMFENFTSKLIAWKYSFKFCRYT